MSSHRTPILLGTRGSPLAVAQSTQVADALRAHGVAVELQIIRTTGDRILDRPLAEAGGKGLFTKELEQALITGEVDFAVHSYKDVPVTMPLVDVSELTIAAVPAREDARDALVANGVGHLGGSDALRNLRHGATVATGSLRRKCQLLAIRPDLKIVGIRGNIDTRLGKWRRGEVDAVVLATAGLRRAGLFEADHTALFDTGDMVPSAGQGALALQCRADDLWTLQVLARLDDEPTRMAVDAERQVVAVLNADCHSPLGAYAHLSGNRLSVAWALGRPGGALPVVQGRVVGTAEQVPALLRGALVGQSAVASAQIC